MAIGRPPRKLAPEDIPRHSANIGRNFKRRRLLMKCTQVQIAKRSQLSQKQISEIERGRSNPTLQTLESIAEVLGISIEELIHDESE